MNVVEVAKQHQWWYSDQNMANLLIHEINRLNSVVMYALHNIDAGGSNVEVLNVLRDELNRGKE